MSPSRLELERQVLRVLCGKASEAPVRELARRLLENYRWSDPASQLVFLCVLELNTNDPALLRAELPARLTRRGFPDVAWEEFFPPLSVNRQEAERLIRDLAGT
jgi:hypothetical protein